MICGRMMWCSEICLLIIIKCVFFVMTCMGYSFIHGCIFEFSVTVGVSSDTSDYVFVALSVLKWEWPVVRI